MNQIEVFEAMKQSIMDASMTCFDDAFSVVDGVEAEPTKEGFDILIYRGDAIPISYRITLQDLNNE